MGPRLDELLSVAGPEVGATEPVTEGLPTELGEMLLRRNGFVAFESALHVFPSNPPREGEMTLQRWNENEVWRTSYDGLADGFLFFAEDAFGGQFAFDSTNRVVSFDPETGAVDQLASDLESWADRIMSDYPLLTGFPSRTFVARTARPHTPWTKVDPEASLRA